MSNKSMLSAEISGDRMWNTVMHRFPRRFRRWMRKSPFPTRQFTRSTGVTRACSCRTSGRTRTSSLQTRPLRRSLSSRRSMTSRSTSAQLVGAVSGLTEIEGYRFWIKRKSKRFLTMQQGLCTRCNGRFSRFCFMLFRRLLTGLIALVFDNVVFRGFWSVFNAQRENEISQHIHVQSHTMEISIF